jgi:fatty acid/phospholipid biosynthesis enzyme
LFCARAGLSARFLLCEFSSLMSYTIASDCMGGDHGPAVAVPAAFAFLRRHPEARVILVGQENVLAPMLVAVPDLAGH